MQWTELTIRTCSEGIELLCAELTEAGFDSFIMDDSAEFHDFLESAREYWDYVDEALAKKMEHLSQVRLYLQGDAAAQVEALRALLQELPQKYPACDFGPLTIRLENVPEEDWANSWKKNYRPLPVGERLLVVPQWMTVDDTQGRLPVLLDLGLAFGTGAHASTQMCMRELERTIRGGERVLDLGSGSGILSITALLLGAKTAVGVDIDPKAEDIARENAAINALYADRFTAVTGDVIGDRAMMERLGGGYDIVLANIVADVIIPLSPVVPHFLTKEGVFICSGILDTRFDEVSAAIERAGMRIVSSDRQEDWRRITAMRAE